ncbi:MAG: type II CRISPR-associated endonuclease Cas1 [Verrucomicrobiota bacterium JB024]|nr:type II CRISPR-associated endonuclease Cas1 [Verrucomicrobiota bacterium JB024]
MSYHIINIDSPRCSISCRQGQLTCIDEDGRTKQVPLEDVAAIVITSFSAQLHSHLLLEAAKHGVALVICERFQPVSLLLPANRSSDTLLTKAALSLERKKVDVLWRKTVDAKCLNQALLAESLVPGHPKLDVLKKRALSKTQTKEGTCARYYWGIFADALGLNNFRRARDEGGVNDLLNFGYAVLLSLTLQKLLACGLDPTLGISHEVRERSTPLAYDIMEPFRPCVDFRVARWVLEETQPGDYQINGRFRHYVTEFVLERVGYLGLEMDLKNCLESVIRGFRSAVLSGQTRSYKPWTPSNSKWAG